MKRLFLILLLLSLIVSLPLVLARIHLEDSNRKLEICLDRSAFQAKCQEKGYSWEEFLLKVREYGVSSLGLEEDNFLEIEEKIYLFTPEEREKLVLLGLIAPNALPPGETWVFPEKNLFERVKTVLGKTLNYSLSFFKRGEYYFLSLPSGVNYANLYYGYNPQKILQARNYGLKTLLKIENLLQIEQGEEMLSSDLKEDISGFTVSKFMTEQGVAVGENLRPLGEGMKFALPEFFPSRQYLPLVSQIVRLHYFGPEEYSLYQNTSRPLEKILSRLIRAVKERNVRLLYLYPLPEEFLPSRGMAYPPGTADYFTEQYKFLEMLKKNLEKGNFQFTVSQAQGKVDLFAEKTRSLRQILALSIACLFPFLGLKFSSVKRGMNRSGSPLHQTVQGSYRGPVANFLFASFLSLSGGILASTLLSSSEFFLKVTEFRGTKIALFFPLLLALGYLYRGEGKKILQKEIRVGQFLFFLGTCLILAFYLLRSGDYFTYLLPGEGNLRVFLERILVIRPRTKEFLFGHPLLILGFCLHCRPLLILGLIGQASLVNTFLHLHTPFLVSFLRSLCGIFLGGIFGYLLIKIYRVFKKEGVA